MLWTVNSEFIIFRNWEHACGISEYKIAFSYPIKGTSRKSSHQERVGRVGQPAFLTRTCQQGFSGSASTHSWGATVGDQLEGNTPPNREQPPAVVEGLDALYSPLSSANQTRRWSCFYFRREDYSIAWLRALRKAGRDRGRYLVLTYSKSRRQSKSEGNVEKHNFIRQGLVPILYLLTISFYLCQQRVTVNFSVGLFIHPRLAEGQCFQ